MRGGTGENTGREGEQRGILSPSAQAAVLHPVKMQSGRSDGQSTIGPKEELSWETGTDPEDTQANSQSWEH